MRCFECHSQMRARQVRGFEIAQCRRCRSVVMQDVAFVGVISGEAGGAEALLLSAELEAGAGGETVGECPDCARGMLAAFELRGVKVGRCAICRTVAVPRGGFSKLRRGVRRKNLLETLGVIREMVVEAAASWLGSILYRW